MDNYSYICQYCGKNYIPKRRGVQKYCSDSCRSRAFFLRNPKTELSTSKLETKVPPQMDKMSWAGVGDAAAGTALVKTAGYLLTPERKRPATKDDLKNLENKLTKRYHRARDRPQDINGKYPFFDIEQGCIVYFSGYEIWRLKI